MTEREARDSAPTPLAPRLLRALIATLLIALALGEIGWLLGRIVTDRWEWSQWLWWIPTPFALAGAMLGVLLLVARSAWLRGSKRSVLVGLAVMLGIGVYFALVEHRLFTPAPRVPQGMLVMHWNWTHTVPHRVDRYVDGILELQPDLGFMTDGQRLRRTRQERQRLEPTWNIEGVSAFTIVSRWPILRARPIVSNETTHVALVEIDTTEAFGRPTTYLLIDLPSKVAIGRMAHMLEVREMIDSADVPAIDMAMGDFNVTRGSASLRVLLPGMHHAFGDAGHGYAASYYRPVPLFHIDHILLSENARATNYQLIDPGHGRHRLQLARVIIGGRPSPPAAP